MKQGMMFILEMLKNKQETILTSILRLILTLIGKSEAFTKTIAEENDCEFAKIILQILLGPGLRCTKFTAKVHYFVLLVLRQMIKHSPAVKQLVMNPLYVESLQAVISLVTPGALESETIQLCVYELLKHLVGQDTDNKRIIGKLMIEKVFWERIKQELLKVDDEDAAIFDDEKTEEAFFKLLEFLTRNVIENAILIKKMRADLDSLKKLKHTRKKTSKIIYSIQQLADELI